MLIIDPNITWTPTYHFYEDIATYYQLQKIALHPCFLKEHVFLYIYIYIFYNYCLGNRKHTQCRRGFRTRNSEYIHKENRQKLNSCTFCCAALLQDPHSKVHTIHIHIKFYMIYT